MPGMCACSSDVQCRPSAKNTSAQRQVGRLMHEHACRDVPPLRLGLNAVGTQEHGADLHPVHAAIAADSRRSECDDQSGYGPAEQTLEQAGCPRNPTPCHSDTPIVVWHMHAPQVSNDLRRCSRQGRRGCARLISASGQTATAVLARAQIDFMVSRNPAPETSAPSRHSARSTRSFKEMIPTSRSCLSRTGRRRTR